MTTRAKRRPKREPTPFEIEMAEAAERRRREHLGDWEERKNQLGTPPPIAPTELHRHDAGCFNDEPPYRDTSRNGPDWWVKRCRRTGVTIGVRSVRADETSYAPDPSTDTAWWALRPGERR